MNKRFSKQYSIKALPAQIKRHAFARRIIFDTLATAGSKRKLYLTSQLRWLGRYRSDAV